MKQFAEFKWEVRVRQILAEFPGVRIAELQRFGARDAPPAEHCNGSRIMMMGTPEDNVAVFGEGIYSLLAEKCELRICLPNNGCNAVASVRP